MGVFKYFSFGSNLLKERIQISNPTARFCCVGKLSGYVLQFDTPLGVPPERKGWSGAAATIQEKTDSYVMGCVWEIDEAQVANLDRQECFYHALFVDVELETGETVNCRTYQMQAETTGITLPSPFYLKVIVDGAKQNKMPAEYIQFLEQLPTNGVTEPPELYLSVMEQIKQFRQDAEKKTGDN